MMAHMTAGSSNKSNHQYFILQAILTEDLTIRKPIQLELVFTDQYMTQLS